MCEREEERGRKGGRQEVWKLVELGSMKQHMDSGLQDAVPRGRSKTLRKWSPSY